MTYQDDELKPENIRYPGNDGTYHGQSDKNPYKPSAWTKTHDPVIVIHKDDFAKILNNLQDEAVKDKFCEVYQVVNDW